MKCTTLISICLVVVALFSTYSPVSCYYHDHDGYDSEASMIHKTQKQRFDFIEHYRNGMHDYKLDAPRIPPAEISCPDETWTKHGTSCFKAFHGHWCDWKHAVDSCKEHHNATLAHIHDKETNDLLQTLLPAKTGRTRLYYYIALNDIKKEGEMEWEGAVRHPINRTPFRNWGAYQPNNYRGNEDCFALLNRNGKWHDIPCTMPSPYICQIHGSHF